MPSEPQRPTFVARRVEVHARASGARTECERAESGRPSPSIVVPAQKVQSTHDPAKDSSASDDRLSSERSARRPRGLRTCHRLDPATFGFGDRGSRRVRPLNGAHDGPSWMPARELAPESTGYPHTHREHQQPRRRMPIFGRQPRTGRASQKKSVSSANSCLLVLRFNVRRPQGASGTVHRLPRREPRSTAESRSHADPRRL
jgi:hypothetical protein